MENRFVFITGATRGIGRQIAQALAAQKANLILHGRSRAQAEKMAEEMRALGAPWARGLGAELSDSAQVESMLDTLQSLAPRLDVVFNNAGLMTPYRTDIWQVPVGDFQQSFAVNAIAPIRICHRLLPGMIERGYGRLVNTTSGIAKEPELMAYAASKAALDKFVYDTAPRLQGTGVSLSLLDPGWLRTDLGGAQAPNAVESVLPGALLPALLDERANGRLYRAQDYAGLSLKEALLRAEAE